MLPRAPTGLPKLRLAMSSARIRSLRELNVVAAGVANNHSMDFGQSGFEGMTHLLNEAGRKPLQQGVPVDLGPFRIEAFTDLDNHRSEWASQLTEAQIKQNIKKAHPPVIAFMHWGTQFDAHPTERQRLVASWLKEAGVGLVVGAHPHVADYEIELTANTGPAVAYTLGNFLFDESSKVASGAVLELRVFEQGTFFARIISPYPPITI